jgi:hypothetical protein
MSWDDFGNRPFDPDELARRQRSGASDPEVVAASTEYVRAVQKWQRDGHRGPKPEFPERLKQVEREAAERRRQGLLASGQTRMDPARKCDYKDCRCTHADGVDRYGHYYHQAPGMLEYIDPADRPPPPDYIGSRVVTREGPECHKARNRRRVAKGKPELGLGIIDDEGM